MVVTDDSYKGFMLFFFENGKVARVPLESYATKQNRSKLLAAYSDKSPLVALRVVQQEEELVLYSTEPRALIFNTALLAPKSTRSTQGVAVMTMKPKFHLERVAALAETGIVNQSRYRVRSVPAAGALLRSEDSDEKQLELL
jgi:DNA gyrase subunit A